MRTALLTLLLFAAPAWAAQPVATIEGPTERKVGQSILLDGRKSVSDQPLEWQLIDGGGRPVLTFDDNGKPSVYAFVPDAEAGEYIFALIAVGTPSGGKPTAAVALHRVVVGEAPGPIPTPPTPTPGPTPGPTPTPTPPGPVAGFRALIVAESTANHTRGQMIVLNSNAVLEYLNRKCIVGTDGRASWRKWDPDIDTTHEPLEWREIWAATKPTLGILPQVVLFNGKAGKVYPLPQTEAAMLNLLQSYGGP